MYNLSTKRILYVAYGGASGAESDQKWCFAKAKSDSEFPRLFWKFPLQNEKRQVNFRVCFGNLHSKMKSVSHIFAIRFGNSLQNEKRKFPLFVLVLPLQNEKQKSNFRFLFWQLSLQNEKRQVNFHVRF